MILVSLRGMALSHEESDNASFDKWIAEMGGEEAFVAMIEDTKRRAADGSLPGFTDAQSLLAYWNRGRRQSA